MKDSLKFKKTHFGLLALFILFSVGQECFCQIVAKDSKNYTEIGNVKDGKRFLTLEYIIQEKSDSTIILAFQNEKYKEITDVGSMSLKGGAKELVQLYDLFKSAFELEDKQEKQYQIGKDNVSFLKSSTGRIMVFVGNKFFTLKPKELDSLFGM